MSALILFLGGLSILIIVHELGHFYSARWLKVRVDEFGIGFPPRLISHIYKDIRYSLNLLPFGGFVRIYGENGEGENEQNSFSSRPAYQRLLILGAGVGMNLVSAWVLFSIGAAVGTPEMVDGTSEGVPVSITGVAPSSPAESAGLRLGDKIIEMSSDEISLRVESERDVSDFVAAHRGEQIRITVRRNKEMVSLSATPRVNAPEGEGSLGIIMGRIVLTRVPWYQAPIAGARDTYYAVSAVFIGLGTIIRDLIFSQSVPAEVAGPVGIYFFGRDVQRLGLAYILGFFAMLSANLAVLNALPIPALDGGRMFFILLEKIKGRRINVMVEHYAHAAGFILLIVLILLVTYQDIIKRIG
jgi:regulator of sigma E protease